jgi:pimeloyl-ACP methyl ester carboxylesterase
MGERAFSIIGILLLASAAIYLFTAGVICCHAQNLPAPRHLHSFAAVAQRNSGNSSGLTMPAAADPRAGRLIVIGFVGGFVKRDDASHPEVQLAETLRLRYLSGVYAQVFENSEREAALRHVLQWLDLDGDGTLTAAEKRQARIIIYGHSWGASETVALARDLAQRNIPVLLTIQVDSIAKPGQNDSLIPPNVANAVNFYQPDGLFHGRPEITAADPAGTRIIGNFRSTYSDQPITSSSSWLARFLMKSHIQIEDDPNIWHQAAALIDSLFSQPGTTAQTQLSGTSAVAR